MKYLILCPFFLLPLLLVSQTSSIKLKSLPDEINTNDNEEYGRWSADGRSLLFYRWSYWNRSKHGMFLASFDSLGQLIEVRKFPISDAHYGGGQDLSPDGKTIIITLCHQPDSIGACDLYISHLTDGQWTTPANMGAAVNSTDQDIHPSFGLDATTLYFTSYRPGGYGAADIWMTKETTPGVWSQAINLGDAINSAGVEGTPFVHFDGSTIYFMRYDKLGMGGFDLYFSKLGEDKKWEKAENMKSPINTVADEGGLVLNPNGHTALITRTTPDKENDLFEFELPLKFQSTAVQLLYVNLKDASTNEPLQGRIELIDIDGTDTVRISKLANERGLISVTLNRNNTYGLIATAKGYVLSSQNLEIIPAQIRYLDVHLIPIANAGSKAISLRNIFFDSGSSTLLPSSIPELNILARMLNENPNMKIEIHGHTDNTGDDESNQLLSEKRAKAVYKFLIDQGINAKMLSFKGFGEELPVSSNETEEGRKENRRTEFVILN